MSLVFCSDWDQNRRGRDRSIHWLLDLPEASDPVTHPCQLAELFPVQKKIYQNREHNEAEIKKELSNLLYSILSSIDIRHWDRGGGVIPTGIIGYRLYLMIPM